LFFAFFSSAAFSQETEAEVEADTASDIYIISSFHFNISGITRRWAIINAAELKIGEEINGLPNLVKFVLDKTQLLVNERVLESADIDYIIGEAQPDGKHPVHLVINTKDSRNIIVFPLPQYSSNSGFKITVKARDYNFLGTMNSLRLDLGYRYDQDGRSFFNAMIDSDTPFRLFNLDWSINFDHDFEYRPDIEEPFYYKNTTGISVILPVGWTTLSLGFNESLYINQENPDSEKLAYGFVQKGLYMSSNPFFFWNIPLQLEIGNYGTLAYSTNFSAVFNHEIASWTLGDNKAGPFLFFGHNLGFGRVDWIGNFLKGFSANVSNSYSYDFYKQRNGKQALSGYLSFTGRAFFTFLDMFGIYTRFIYRQWFFDNYSSGAGDVMRGILDNTVTSDLMFSLNLDLSFKLLEIRPGYWFNTPLFKYLDMDFHLASFFDIAYYRNPLDNTPNKESFFVKNMLMSGGIEAVFFPVHFRSFFLRASLGFNLSSRKDLGNYEIYIGTELHY
jgi:hypothetical protein